MLRGKGVCRAVLRQRQHAWLRAHAGLGRARRARERRPAGMDVHRPAPPRARRAGHPAHPLCHVAPQARPDRPARLGRARSRSRHTLGLVAASAQQARGVRGAGQCAAAPGASGVLHTCLGGHGRGVLRADGQRVWLVGRRCACRAAWRASRSLPLRRRWVCPGGPEQGGPRASPRAPRACMRRMGAIRSCAAWRAC